MFREDRNTGYEVPTEGRGTPPWGRTLWGAMSSGRPRLRSEMRGENSGAQWEGLRGWGGGVRGEGIGVCRAVEMSVQEVGGPGVTDTNRERT